MASPASSDDGNLIDGSGIGCLPGRPCAHGAATTAAAEDPPLQRPRGRALAASGSRRRAGHRHPTRGATYVSLGKVRAFAGDVYPSPALALALENRSYRRELILITDTRPRAALQLYYNLAQLGLVHVLWLTSSNAACGAMERLATARDELVRQRQAVQEARAAAGARALLSGGDGGGGGAAGGGERVLDSEGVDGAEGAAESVSVSLYSAAATLAEAYVNGDANGTDTRLNSDDLLGCAWSSQPFPPGFSGHRRLMMKRVTLLARSVRLGYNVLSLDTDVVVYRDPYPLLKAPPYGDLQMVVGKSVRSGGVANTGVMYVHKAARSGSVAWLLAEVVDRNLRWVEHNVSMPHMAAAAVAAATGAAVAGPLRLMPPMADSRGCWDQFLFGDVVLTGATGKLVLLYCARPVSGAVGPAGVRRGLAQADAPGGDEEEGGWTARHFAAMKLLKEELLQRDTISVEGDTAMTYLVGGKSYTHQVVELSIPRDPTPLLADEPGYSLPDRRPGGAAEAFQRVLQEDASHAEARSGAGAGGAAGGGGMRQLQQQLSPLTPPLLVAPYGSGSGVTGAGAGANAGGNVSGPAAGRERLVYAAEWLIGGWTQRGVLGYWDPQLTGNKPKQVFAHLVRAPGPTGLGKDAVRMQYGEYDWELAALAGGGPFAFLGSPDAAEPPRVVALHPDVDTTTIGPVQWTTMARGLVQIALLTGRRVAWPSVPCDSRWVQPHPGSRRALPLNMNLRFLTHGSFSEGLSCTPAALLHQKCLYARHVVERDNSTSSFDVTALDGSGGPEYITRKEGPRGLLPPEFALLRRLLPDETAPGPHNTVHLQTNDDYEDGGDGERPVMFDEPPRTEDVAYVKAPEVIKPLREGPLAAERVLYLAQRTFLTQLDKLNDSQFMAQYRAFRNECPALK